MQTTITNVNQQSSPVCPPWCTETEHFDWGKPGNAGADYDPIAQGSFCHSDDGIDVAGYSVSLSSSTDFAGNANEEPRVFLDGHDLTIEQAMQLGTNLVVAAKLLHATVKR